MALTKAQLLELPGRVIPVGAIKAGTGIVISAAGVISVDPNVAVLKLLAGTGIALTPSSGLGDVTIALDIPPAQPPTLNTGDRMFFFNSTAPLGWVKVTATDDATIRVVSGTGGNTGGTTGFTAAFTNFTPAGGISGVTPTGSIDASTISQGQMPSHSHQYESRECSPIGIQVIEGGQISRCTQGTQFEGGNGSHTHSFSGTITGGFTGNSTTQFAVQYIDCLLCSKT
jgi:hypothetical protein